MIFDTLAYAKKLREAGCPEEQAEVQAEEMSKVIAVISDNIVTKKHHDRSLKEMEVSLRRDMKEMELALKHDIQDVRNDMEKMEIALKRDIQDVRNDMQDLGIRLRYDLTVRMGGMITAAVAVIAVLIKIL